ncbi:MAG: Crp/Fnr family transcriptional regulator [Hyphomicrobiaceae bacterium]|nr:MAG: Crp/Fnr family transcriptional regulator [Hyphomicrobiaceae bacterium]
MFDELPQSVRRQTGARELAKGEPLFEQGDQASAIFEVLSGRVRLVRRTIDDHLVALFAARPGDLLAEAALFSDSYHCDAVAATRSRVRIYPKRVLLSALRKNPALFEGFAARLARQLQGLRARMELRNIRSARERLLQYLWLSADSDGRTVSIDGQLQDLAADLGLSREALYRTLAMLEADGIIERAVGGLILKKAPRT